MRFAIPTMIAMLALVSGIAGLALPWAKGMCFFGRVTKLWLIWWVAGSELTVRVAETDDTDLPCFDEEDDEPPRIWLKGGSCLFLQPSK